MSALYLRMQVDAPTPWEVGGDGPFAQGVMDDHGFSVSDDGVARFEPSVAAWLVWCANNATALAAALERGAAADQVVAAVRRFTAEFGSNDATDVLNDAMDAYDQLAPDAR